MPDKDLDGIVEPSDDPSDEDTSSQPSGKKPIKGNPDLRIQYYPREGRFRWIYKDKQKQAEADSIMDSFWDEVRKRDPGSAQNMPPTLMPIYEPKNCSRPVDLIRLMMLNLRPDNHLPNTPKSPINPVYGGDILASIVQTLEPKYGMKKTPVRYHLTEKNDGSLQFSIHYQNSDLHAQISYTFDKRLADGYLSHNPDGAIFITHFREDLKLNPPGNPITRQVHINSIQIKHHSIINLLSRLEATVLDPATSRQVASAAYVISLAVREKNNGRQELGRYSIAFPINGDNGCVFYNSVSPKILSKKSPIPSLPSTNIKNIEDIGQDFNSAVRSNKLSLSFFLDIYGRKPK